MHIPKGIVRLLIMDDYTQHPLWNFSQNHPEYPDVCHDSPITESTFDEAFDGESLRFQERMMLCMDDICRERAKDVDYYISPKNIVRISKAWSLDAMDHVMVLDDVLMFLDIQEDIASFLDSKGGE